MIPIIFPKVPEKGASDEEWTKYDKNLQDVISKHINDAIKKASDETTAVSDSIPEIASSAQAIAGIDNETIISPLRMREGFNASGSAPVYACRAWISFDGTGTPAVRGSGNFSSSITDNGTGNYTVNFTTAMPDANYCVTGTSSFSGGDARAQSNVNISERSTTYIRIFITDATNNTAEDRTYIDIAIFR